MAQEMIKIRNKKTGEIKIVPRDQYIVEPELRNGFAGIADDIMKSARTAPDALLDTITGLAKSAKGAGKYALTTNPVSTFANLGVGGVEGGAALISSPQMMMRYIAEKFPELAKDNGTLASHYLKNAKQHTDYENLMRFEQEHGLAPQSEDERGVRDIGGLIFGGKGLTKIPSRTGRIAALSAQQAGAGGDPLHAAMLGMIGEMVGSRIKGKVQNDANAPAQPSAQPFTPPSAVTSASFNQPIIPGMNVTLGGFGVIPEAVKAIPDALEKTKEGAKNLSKNAKEIAYKGTAKGVEALGKGASYIPVAGQYLHPASEILSSYLNYKSISPETYAIRKVLGGLRPEDLPMIEEMMKAKRGLPLSFLTPGEASQSPKQAAREANLGRTEKGSQLLLDRAKARTGTQAESIYQLEDQIYDPDKLEPKKQAAYNATLDQTLPPEFLSKWNNDLVVQDAIKLLNSKGTYKKAVKDVPVNSFRYWNYVKRAIADMEKGDAKNLQKFSSDEATKTRNQMVEEMDFIEPEYANARKIAEREFIKDEITNALDKKEYTINNLKELFKSKKRYNKLVDRLSPYPEALETLQNLKKLSGNLLELDDSIRKAYVQERTGMAKDRNQLDALKRALDQRYGEEYDVKAVDLMTSDWLPILRKELAKKGK